MRPVRRHALRCAPKNSIMAACRDRSDLVAACRVRSPVAATNTQLRSRCVGVAAGSASVRIVRVIGG